MAPDTVYASFKSAPADCSTLGGDVPGGLPAHPGAPRHRAGGHGHEPADGDRVLVVLHAVGRRRARRDRRKDHTAADADRADRPRRPVANRRSGKADIYVGSTRLPYYLTPPANANDTASVLTKFWTAAGPSQVPGIDGCRNLTMFNPSPAKVADVTVPSCSSMPNADSACPRASPPHGWPVAIFQHGITRNRTNALAIADSYAKACFVVAAMDLPLHGITDRTTHVRRCIARRRSRSASARRSARSTSTSENNTTGAAGKDGIIDASGTHLINLAIPARAATTCGRRGRPDPADEVDPRPRHRPAPLPRPVRWA